jgi:hypothetical protein
MNKHTSIVLTREAIDGLDWLCPTCVTNELVNVKPIWSGWAHDATQSEVLAARMVLNKIGKEIVIAHALIPKRHPLIKKLKEANRVPKEGAG